MKTPTFLIAFLVFSGLFAQDVPDNLSDAEKIFGLSKVWKEADKNFVFFDQVPDLDWEQTYQEYIPKVLATRSTYGYYKQLQAFCSLLNDGHSKVVVPWQLRKIHEASPPLKAELIGKKVLITEIRNDTLKEQGLSVGMEILEIDGTDVHQYANQYVKPYVSYSTPQDMNVQVYEYNLLKGHIDQPLQIKTRNGKVFAIDRKMTKNKKQDPIFSFEVLENNIGYLSISRFWGENFNAEFDSIYPMIRETSSLILDVSDNLGGNTGFCNYLLSHFVDRAFQSSRWKSLMYIPAYASWGNDPAWIDHDGDIVQPVEASKRYTKPIVVLISEKTYSAGEDFVSAFLNTKRGLVIGRATAGTTGNPIGFALPGQGGLQICSKRDYLANGKEFVGYGIMPEKQIDKTADKNHLIKAGLEFLKE